MRGAARGWETWSLVLVVLALVPAAAHLFELPNKIGLAPQDYMIVQRIYSGWALFGVVVLPALLATFVHALQLRHQPGRFAPALLGFLLLAASHALFWIFTQPMNRVTQNWTQLPADFEQVRAQWEYSHAAAALLIFLAFLALLQARAVDPTPPPAPRVRPA